MFRMGEPPVLRTLYTIGLRVGGFFDRRRKRCVVIDACRNEALVDMVSAAVSNVKLGAVLRENSGKFGRDTGAPVRLVEVPEAGHELVVLDERAVVSAPGSRGARARAEPNSA